MNWAVPIIGKTELLVKEIEKKACEERIPHKGTFCEPKYTQLKKKMTCNLICLIYSVHSKTMRAICATENIQLQQLRFHCSKVKRSEREEDKGREREIEGKQGIHTDQ